MTLMTPNSTCGQVTVFFRRTRPSEGARFEDGNVNGGGGYHEVYLGWFWGVKGVPWVLGLKVNINELKSGIPN